MSDNSDHKALSRIPSEGPNSTIGMSVHRVEDQRLLTGRGLFVENHDSAEMAHAFFVRSPIAHGRILSIDTDAARAMPNVLAVFTGTDIEAAGLQPLPCAAPQASSDGTPFVAPTRHALAVGTVRHVGEAVAMVVAESEIAARDAAEQIDVSYEDLPPEMDTATSRQIAFDWQTGNAAGVEEGFEAATHIVSVKNVINNRVIVSPIETRSAIGSFEPESGRYKLLTQSQGVHLLKRQIATTLAIPKDDLLVLTEDVGGSFATKLMNYPEQTMVLFAARHTGRTVRWVSGRDEAFLSDAHARDHVSDADLALDANGRFLALRITTRGSLGAYASAVSPSIAGPGFAKVAGHNYAFPALTVRSVGVYTNTAPTDAYRGAGKPEVIYLVERLIEKAARSLGFDRVALRRENLVPADAFPYPHANGFTYDSGDFRASFDAALAAADFDGFQGRRAQSEQAGQRRGIAICAHLHLSGGSPTEVSAIEVTAAGKVLVKTGVQASGQGHQTALAQVVSSRLEVPLDRIEVLEGDSDQIKTGGGTGGSSSLPIAATTIDRATLNLLDTATEQAADKLEAAKGDIEYGEGTFTVVGTDRSIGLFELSRDLQEDGLPGCAGGATFAGDHQTVPHGAQVCEVEVDPQTGAIKILNYISADDLGIKLNPMIADGQIHGGIAQGVGQAWLEHTVYDEETGQLLTGSFMDYTLPRASDLPDFQLIAVDTPTDANHLGMKGVGELGTNGGLAPFICAVCDALGHDDLEMPATPENVWRALHHKSR